jgi:hypothetical protein
MSKFQEIKSIFQQTIERIRPFSSKLMLIINWTEHLETYPEQVKRKSALVVTLPVQYLKPDRQAVSFTHWSLPDTLSKVPRKR